MNENRGYSVEGEVIVIHRDLTALDFFVRDFLETLKKHSDYLVVSGFVSICSGRIRATEDVDILVPIMDFIQFTKLFDDLSKKFFWCYQGENIKEDYDYLKRFESLRFARKDELFPNIEFIPIDESRKLKYFEFRRPQKIRIHDFEFKIPPIEFEILYKEIKLGSEKDFEDAKHLRVFFKDILSEDKFKIYNKLIRGSEK